MSVKSRTLKDLRELFYSELKEIYPENEIIAITNLVIKTQIGIDRLHLLLNSGEVVSSQAVEKITEICRELKTGKPVQYVLGVTMFYDCIIKVDNNTLIPRPETEELVDLVIKENPDFGGNIIDIGTGSGCIAIAIKKNIPSSEVTGIDISEKALETATVNALLNNITISFLKADIFKLNPQSIPQAGIIISNPPYVLESEKKVMNRNILDFEPHNALFVPDEDPLLYYRAIVNVSEKILKPGGRIYFEINEKKGEEMKKLLDLHQYTDVRVVRDINGKDRLITGRKNG